MTDEQIKQNAEEYILPLKVLPGADENITFIAAIREAFVSGAHSRDDEVNDLLSQLEDKDGYIAHLRKELDKLRNPWISVEEGLPNLEGVVFFRLPKGRPYVGSYFTKDKLFMSIEGCYFVEGVTHWMPIPELKGGNR